MTALKKHIESNIFLPKEIDQSCVAMNNLIATRTQKIVTKLIDTQQELTIQITPFKVHDKSAFVTLYLKLWGESVSLTLSAWPQVERLQRFVSNKELLELPEELATLTLSIAFEALLRVASNVFASKIEIIGFSLPIKETKNDVFPSVNFTLTIENEAEIQAALTVPDVIQNRLMEVLKTIPKSSGISLMSLTAHIYFECGRNIITQDILLLVEPGDVLMMDSHDGQDLFSLRMRLPSGQVFLAEKINDSGTYEIIKEENDMQNEDYEEKISLNEIPLNLHFDLGNQSLSLEEIKKIGIGYTFEIEKNLQELVTLRIANKTIGYGELVTIGDRTGVRVTQINQD